MMIISFVAVSRESKQGLGPYCRRHCTKSTMTIPAPDSSWSKIMRVQLLPSGHQILTPQSDHTEMLRYYIHIHCLHIGALVEFTSGNINLLSVSYCREGVCMLCMMCLLLWSTQQVPWASETGPSHDTIISIALPSYFGVICTSRDASREQSLCSPVHEDY